MDGVLVVAQQIKLDGCCYMTYSLVIPAQNKCSHPEQLQISSSVTYQVGPSHTLLSAEKFHQDVCSRFLLQWSYSALFFVVFLSGLLHDLQFTVLKMFSPAIFPEDKDSLIFHLHSYCLFRTFIVFAISNVHCQAACPNIYLTAKPDK